MQVKIAIRFHRAEITYFRIYKLYAYKLYAYIFYKLTKNYNFLNSNVTLIEFEHWLENRVKEYFNPIANIIGDNELRKQEIGFKSIVNGTYLPSTNEDNDPCCWLCKQKHWLMNCPEFINKSLDEKKNFIVQNGLCWISLSKSHFVQNCNAHFRCKVDNCRQLHHTLLHETSPNPPSTIEQATVNSQSVNPHTFLQIITITISNASRKVTTNAFLDSGSDTTLISKV